MLEKYINDVTERVLDGENVTEEEILRLINIDEKDEEALEVLFKGANRIREKYSGNSVNLCTIMNVKSGKCSEDCKYCAQSIHYKTGIEEYSLLNYDEILERALEMEKADAHKFSLVTSGRGISGEDFEKVLQIYRRLKEDTTLDLCASHGIISYEQARLLKEAGVSMYHHNIETSSTYYSNICITHSYEDRIETIKNVTRAGLDICCGCIIGMGESLSDRVKIMFELKDLGIKSVPINILNPAKGTPLGNMQILSPNEILKTMALFRYVIPNGHIRYAGGRKALLDKQSVGFKAGINAALVGNYLTTIGSNIDDDKNMILSQGLNIY